MNINTRHKDDITIFDIKGDVEIYSADNLKKKIDELIVSEKLKLIINLKDVPYIDSSGIGVLVAGNAAFKKNNGSLKLVNISSSIQRIFNLTELSSIFEIYDSESKAFEHFK